MESLHSFFLLMFAAAFLVGIAQKIQLSYPIALVIGGTILGFIPGLTPFHFDPNLILVIVLPPILYYASFGISFREFKNNWKEIFSLALGLVFITTLVAGVIFKWLFPEFPWALAFAFGAIVSPPDAISAITILKRFPLSPRLLAILEGESLVNDASALVLYRLAVTALLSGAFSLSEASYEFSKAVIGGVGIGLILGMIIQTFSRKYLEAVVGTVVSIMIPYITYIIAHSLGVSGVLAVVTNGLVGARVILSHPSPLRRILGSVMWDMFAILLNCFVFILIGLQLQSLVKDMTPLEIVLNVSYGFLFTFVLVTVRLVWMYARYGFNYLKNQKNPKSSSNQELLGESALIGWAGMRGIVSLVAALALPFAYSDGTLIDGREEVIFVTFIVIWLTLILPGLTLPSFIRWFKLSHPKDHSTMHKARKELEKVAEEKIREFHASRKLTNEEFNFLSTYFTLQRRVSEVASSSFKKFQELELLRLEIIREQRNRLLEMWEQHQLSDKQLNQLEHELDLNETRLARAEL